jgi:hypothetical protein
MAKLAKTQLWNTGGAVHYRTLGSVGIELGLDYSKAPVPDHFYFADYLSVDEDSSQVMFTFGKLDKPKTDVLRSKVEIYFNPVMFIKQYWTSSRDLHKIAKKLAVARGLPAIPQIGLLSAPKVQTFQANQVSMLMTEGECIIDFFYLSPKDMFYKPPRNEKIDVEALVRIILSPPMLLSLLDLSEPIAEKLKPVYGDENATLEPKRI